MDAKSRDPLYLRHILECIANVEADVRNDLARLLSDRTIRDAVLRNLQVLAESTQRLSDETKLKRPEIPWDNISGFRHRLVHDYFNIDLNLIWRVIDEHLPELKVAAGELLASFEG